MPPSVNGIVTIHLRTLYSSNTALVFIASAEPSIAFSMAWRSAANSAFFFFDTLPGGDDR